MKLITFHRGFFISFLGAFAIAFVLLASITLRDALPTYLAIAPSQFRTLAMLYQAGWIFSFCFPVAFFAGISFAAARSRLGPADLRRLMGPICLAGVVASVLFYFYNDLVLPEANHRVVIYHVAAMQHDAESDAEPQESVDSAPRSVREMTTSMLRSRLRAYNDAETLDETRERFRRHIQVELEKRYSLSFSPFAFAVAGLALGLYVRQLRGWLAFLVSVAFFAPFVFMLSLLGRLAGQGHISPVAFWFPGILLLGAGCLALLIRLRATSAAEEEG